MLKKEDKIFKNLYNELGWEIDNSIKRDDWKDTKNLISKGKKEIAIYSPSFVADCLETTDELGHELVNDCLLYTSPSPRD